MKLQIFDAASKYLKDLTKTLSKKSPTILTGLAVTGTIGVAVLSHVATKKAVKKMEEVRSEEDYEEPESKAEEIFEEVKETWAFYVPVAIVLTVTIVSEIQSNRINLKRIAILTDAYRMSENLRKEYQEKTKEIVGKNKEEKIRSELARDNIENTEAGKEVIYDTGEGTTIFKDGFTGQLFFQDLEKMRRARNNLDAKLLRDDYSDLNEWFYLIKLKSIGEVGKLFGWNIDRLDRHDLSDIAFIPDTTSDGQLCYLVDYRGHLELNYDMYEPN